MNPQEYILSGIVESYVLGLASPEDGAEFELMCDAHQEVRAARNAFELQLEQSLLQQKMQPPRALKSRIFSEIGMEKDEQPPLIISGKPILIPRKGFARYVAAASLILLLGSVLLNLYLLNQYKKSIAQYKELAATQTQITGANQILSNETGDLRKCPQPYEKPTDGHCKNAGHTFKSGSFQHGNSLLEY